MALLTELSTSGLTTESSSLLAKLGELDFASSYYLAGSAALTLYLAHRRVRDLDFMSSESRLVSPERRDLLSAFLAHDPRAQVETARDGYLFLRTDRGVGLRFFHYPYPLVEATGEISGVRVAALMDLALMKLGAIISRALPHDFADFYLLTRSLPLNEILPRSAAKFPHVRDFPLQALKALAAMPEAPDEPLPRFSKPVDWGEMRVWIEEEVKPFARDYLGMETTPE